MQRGCWACTNQGSETLTVSEEGAPKTRVSPFCESIFGEDVPLLPSFSRVGASSSVFFFLNRVSVIGRKNVHSNKDCLQC